MPIPASTFLHGDLLIPVLEVAVLEPEAVGPDPAELGRDGIAPRLPAAVSLASPSSLPVAMRKAVIRAGHHLLSFPYACPANVEPWHASVLFLYGTVSAWLQGLFNDLLGMEEDEQDQQEKDLLHFSII